MVGAAAHNAGQVPLMMLLLKTTGLLYYFTNLVLVGLGCDFLTVTDSCGVIGYMIKINTKFRQGDLL